MQNIKFVVQGVPESLNKSLRKHWAARKKDKETWSWMIIVALKQIKQYPVIKTLENVRLIITQYRHRFLDKDNLYGSCKGIIDCLKVRKGIGLIRDDDDEHCKLTIEQKQIKMLEPEYVVIEAIEIEEAKCPKMKKLFPK